MRSLAAVVVALGFAHAPMQCQSEPPASERNYERPEEALYELAGRFKTQGQLEAWRTTLLTIVDRYPNSRQAVMAKDDLAKAPAEDDRAEPAQNEPAQNEADDPASAP